MKSDDVVGRVKTYEAIIKGENIPKPGIPESFKVMLKELQALALDITLLDEDNNEVKLKETSEYGNTNINSIISSSDREDRNKGFAFESSEDFTKGGFTTQEVNEETGEFVNVEEDDADADMAEDAFDIDEE